MLVYADVVHVTNRQVSELLSKGRLRLALQGQDLLNYTGFGCKCCDYLVVSPEELDGRTVPHAVACTDDLCTAVHVAFALTEMLGALYGLPRTEVWVLDDRTENAMKCYRMAVAAC